MSDINEIQKIEVNGANVPFVERGTGLNVVSMSGGRADIEPANGIIEAMSETCYILSLDRLLCGASDINLLGHSIFEMCSSIFLCYR